MDPVVHFEVPGRDMGRMKTFYEKAFGWQTQQLGPDAGAYVLVTTSSVGDDGFPTQRGSINGGFFSRLEDERWNQTGLTVSVESLADSVAAVEAAGGEILVRDHEIPGVGMYASFLDTEGNRMSLLQPHNG